MNPETRAFLHGVRHADDPTPEDERRVLAGVHATIAAGVLVGGATGASKATKLTALFGISALKLGGVLVGLGALAWVGGWVLPHRDGAPVRAVVSAGELPRNPTPVARISEPLPSAPETLEQPENPPLRPPVSNEPRVRDPSPASLREEIALLADVKAALARGDGATALARLDGHVTTDRQLLAERRAARILALCALRRVGEARDAAAKFLLDDPGSVQRGAIERSCATTIRTDER